MSASPADHPSIKTDVTSDDAEAKTRYDVWMKRDPFPEIQPALLHSADVFDYVRATGMVCPFRPDRLKASSYEVSIGDRLIYWDAESRKHDIPLREGEEFALESNSIVFVTTAEIFRLPYYIAARFNLRITHVHRGLLVGTGPLVDPGFAGRLLIPLHNLTTNKYMFRSGQRFAWFEFTKVGPHESWTDGYVRPNRLGSYVPFPDNKRYIENPNVYLDKALEEVSAKEIRSSIPSIIVHSQKSAEQSADHAKRAGDAAARIRNIAAGIGFLAAAGVIAATAAVVIGTWNIISDTRTKVTELTLQSEDLRAVRAELDALANEMRLLTSRAADAVAVQPERVQSQLEALWSAISAVEARVDALQHWVEGEQTRDEPP